MGKNVMGKTRHGATPYSHNTKHITASYPGCPTFAATRDRLEPWSGKEMRDAKSHTYQVEQKKRYRAGIRIQKGMIFAEEMVTNYELDAARKLERNQRRLHNSAALVQQHEADALKLGPARESGRAKDPWQKVCQEAGDVYPPGSEGFHSKRGVSHAGEVRWQQSDNMTGAMGGGWKDKANIFRYDQLYM